MKTKSIHETELLEAVLENAGALVVVLDHEGRIHHFNRACEKLSGYSFAEVEGKFPWETFLPPEDAEITRKNAFEALANNPQSLTGHYTNYWIAKNGQCYLTEWNNSLLLDEHGQMAFMVALGSDITERQRMEDALRASEAWLLHTQALADIGSWEYDAVSDKLKWSEQTYRIFGVDPEEFIASDEAFKRCVHPDDRAAVELAYDDAVRGHRLYDIVHRIVRPSGEIRWVHERGEPIYDETGKALRTIGAVQDITDQRLAEQSMLDSTQQLNEAQRIAKVGSWDLDLASNRLVWSDEIFRIFEIDKSRFGASYEAFLNTIHPDDRDLVNQAYSDSLANRSPYEIVHRLLMTDGRIKYVRETCESFFDGDGKPVRSVGTVQDISELHKTELELRQYRDHLEELVHQRTDEVRQQAQRNEAIINTALDGFFSVDMFGCIRSVNPAFCAMLGYEENELLRMAVPDIEANERPEDVAAHIQKMIREGYDRFDTRHRRKDGSLLDVEMSVTFVENGGEKMFYAFAHDITPRKQSEAALIRAREEAEQANQAKSEFLSRMSHELRTPLNAILGFGQLLEYERLTPTQRENVGEIVNAGRHLLDLINEILDLSRIEAGKIDLSMETVELGSLITECLTMVGPLAAQRKILVESPSNPCRLFAVKGDRIRLRQILINLLSNAIKYNHERGRVFIECQATPEGNVRLSIRDTGQGINQDALPRLFRPFERLESPYAGIEGTGIGLCLAKRLTEAMDGKIGVDSQVGVGSTFWVELPAAEHAPESAQEDMNNASMPLTENPPSTILYIEDNPINLRLMRKVINKFPELKMLEALTAEIGLAMARTDPPNIILMDINLPGMDGYEALQQLRADPSTRDIPIIAITANAMKNEYERGLAVGFDDYVIKPLDVSYLSNLLREYLSIDGDITEDTEAA